MASAPPFPVPSKTFSAVISVCLSTHDLLEGPRRPTDFLFDVMCVLFFQSIRV